jgi:hypothetical protein
MRRSYNGCQCVESYAIVINNCSIKLHICLLCITLVRFLPTAACGIHVLKKLLRAYSIFVPFGHGRSQADRANGLGRSM